MELNIFKAKRVFPKTVLHVTQNKIGDDGKPGTIEILDVASVGILAAALCGYNRDGDAIFYVPLSEVALAIVSEK